MTDIHSLDRIIWGTLYPTYDVDQSYRQGSILDIALWLGQYHDIALWYS